MKSFSPHLDIFADPQKAIWCDLNSLPEQFVLYGGTAIALRLGHRSSVDFDFFSTPSIEDMKLFELPLLANCAILQREQETLSLIVERGGPVKLSFLGGLNFGRVADPEKSADGVTCVASLLDLFAHKLKVLLQRVECKDYADIAAILRSGLSLAEGIEAALGLFGNRFPPAECIKALTYFEGGDLGDLTRDEREILITSVRKLPKNFSKKSVVSANLRY